MVSANTLCKKLLNVKTAVVESADFYSDQDGVNHISIHAKPNKWHENDCPIYRKRCKCYDSKNLWPRSWRGLDWGTTLVEVIYDTHRIDCPGRGVLGADVPCNYPDSGFLKDFDLTVGWLSIYLLVLSFLYYIRSLPTSCSSKTTLLVLHLCYI